MTTGRLSSLALLHAYKDIDIDINTLLDVFAARKDSRPAFLFRE